MYQQWCGNASCVSVKIFYALWINAATVGAGDVRDAAATSSKNFFWTKLI